MASFAARLLFYMNAAPQPGALPRTCALTHKFGAHAVLNPECWNMPAPVVPTKAQARVLQPDRWRSGRIRRTRWPCLSAPTCCCLWTAWTRHWPNCRSSRRAVPAKRTALAAAVTGHPAAIACKHFRLTFAPCQEVTPHRWVWRTRARAVSQAHMRKLVYSIQRRRSGN